MKLGIMQPYFLPYIGYYSLMDVSDTWVIFDTPQYIRKGWVNRNRILKKGGGVKYIKVPVAKAPRDTPINKIEIADLNWKEELINQLDHYQHAPYRAQVLQMLEEILACESNNLSKLIQHSLEVTCNHIGIQTKMHVFSEMEMDLDGDIGPGDWAPLIAKRMGAEVYVNPPGGKEIFDRQSFEGNGIELKFLRHNLPEYEQGESSFEPGLSIIDVLMYNSIDETRSMLTNYHWE